MSSIKSSSIAKSAIVATTMFALEAEGHGFPGAYNIAKYYHTQSPSEYADPESFALFQGDVRDKFFKLNSNSLILHGIHAKIHIVENLLTPI